MIVVEVSSFMAYAIKKFKSDYSICTNIKRDHLNWHRDLQGYFDAKMRVLETTKKKSFINAQVIRFADEHSLKFHLPIHGRIFQSGKPDKNSQVKDWTDGERIIISEKKKYTLSETQFSGLHNAMNILAA